MADRNSLRLAATLLLTGSLLYVLATFFHVMIDAANKTGSGNNHPAVFTAIAAGGNWTAVHLGQFIAIAILTAGLLALYYALNITAGMPLWANRLGAVAAVVSLALAGVVYAVDGVALKQAVDSWAHAPAAEQTARFASAETMRWLEWGSRSYQFFLLGLALILFATAIVWTARITRPIGYVMALLAITTFVVGWQTGVEGFAPSTNTSLSLWAALLLVWIVWLLIVAWRMREPVLAESG
jgi:hypothetical protein